MEAPEFQALAQRLLIKAAQKLAGVTALADFLQVLEGTLAVWIAGKEVPPATVILKAVELLIDEPVSFWRASSDLNDQPSKPKQ